VSAQTTVTLLTPFCLTGISNSHHYAWFIGWDGISQTFCPGWPQTSILWISTSQVDRRPMHFWEFSGLLKKLGWGELTIF
jgi:hypothetical protein